MLFNPTPLAPACLVDVEPIHDARGFFARTWSSGDMAKHGLVSKLSQCSISWNRHVGTVRGMHYQRAPHEEAKTVRCTRGAIFDVVVDVRPNSPTFLRWFGAKLDEQNRRMMFVPEGFAHGFQTLADDTEVLYLISAAFEPNATAGIRWDDPLVRIEWPLPISVISDRDAGYPDFQ